MTLEERIERQWQLQRAAVERLQQQINTSADMSKNQHQVPVSQERWDQVFRSIEAAIADVKRCDDDLRRLHGMP